MTVEEILRHNLRGLMELRGVSQAALVRMVGGGRTHHRSDAWLSRILRPSPNPAERRSMRLPDLERVAKALGVSAHELLTPGLTHASDRRQHQRRSHERRQQDRRVEPFPPPDL